MTAKQARALSEQYLQEDREHVDMRIMEACARGHYKVWVQEVMLENVDDVKDYYRALGFTITEHPNHLVREFLISWEYEQ